MTYARLLTIAVVAAAAALMPATAHAATLCVGTPVFVTCDANYPATPSGLTQALTDADNETLRPGYDGVRLQAGTYSFSAGLTVTPTGSIYLGGEGSDKTFIEATDPGATALSFGASSCTSCTVAGLSVRSTNASAAGNPALVLDDAFGHAIAVTQNDNTGTAVELSDSSKLEYARIALSAGGESTGVLSPSGNNAVRETRIAGAKYGIVIEEDTTSIRDTFVDLANVSDATGVVVDHPDTDTEIVTANLLRSTIVGNGPNQTGVWTIGEDNDQEANANVSGTLVLLTGTNRDSFICEANGTGDGAIDITYSAFGIADVTDDGCFVDDDASIDTATTDLRLTTSYESPYRPYFGSPLIDAADPSDSLSLVSDATGKSRRKDGNGGGTIRADIGAFEYQRTAPKARSATDRSLGNGVVELNGVFEDADGEPISVVWDFGDGERGSGVPVTHLYAYKGSYVAVATVTDPAGLTDTENETVSAAGDPKLRPNFDIALSTLRGGISHKRMFSLSRKRTRGAVKLTVATGGKAVATISQLVDGVRDQGKCRKRKRGERGGRACSISVPRGKPISYTLPAATHWLAPGGRFGRTKLSKGKYQLDLRGYDPRGQETKHEQLRFTLK